MHKKNTISNNQIKNLLITSVIGVGILSLPSNMASILDNDGWLAILVGGLLIVPLIFMVDRLFKMFPNKDIFQIGEEVLGRILFTILLIVIIIYTILTLAYAIRVFGEVIKGYLLDRTPIKVIIITMLLAACYLARAEIEVLGRMATMVYPILIGLIIFLVLISIAEGDFTNILPVFNADFTLLPKGILISLFSYAGYEIILLAYTTSDNKKDALKYTLRGLFIVIGMYVITFFSTLSQLGVNQLKRRIWPTIAIANEVDLPGYFIENLDGIVLTLWVLIVYTTLGPILYTGGRALAYIFNTRSHDIFILPLIPLIYIVSIIPDNIISVYENMGIILGYMVIISAMAIPIFIYLVALIKKRRRKA